MTLTSRVLYLANRGSERLNSLAPAVDLLVRLWVADAFWKSGLTKIATWDATLYLFEYEYAVPLLSPWMAAVVGTGIELAMPVLLAIGLATRSSAIVLFFFNIAAVASFPAINFVDATDHQFWGLLLLVTTLHGPGKFSVDHYLMNRLRHDPLA